MGDIEVQEIKVSVIVPIYNTEKFLQNKKLEKLADIRKGESTMKEFDMNDLLG